MLDFQAKTLFDSYQIKRKFDLKIEQLKIEMQQAKDTLDGAIHGGILKDLAIGESITEHGYIFKMKAHYGKHKYLIVEKIDND